MITDVVLDDVVTDEINSFILSFFYIYVLMTVHGNNFFPVLDDWSHLWKYPRRKFICVSGHAKAYGMIVTLCDLMVIG